MRRQILMSCLLGALGICSLAAAEAVKCVAVPADGVIKLTDYGFRDWGPEVVHYTVDANRFAPGKLELLDAAGQAVPFQITKGEDGQSVLEFVAVVKKGQTATYALKAGQDRSKENTRLVHTMANEGVEVGNEFFALRLPRPEAKKLDGPIAADQVPPPILRWKQQGFDWVGGARFFTDRKVAAYELACVEDGPASVVYRARYTFEPKGQYVWQVRVSTGVPVALVTEEFDFGQITEGHDFLMLGVGENWKPEEIGFIGGDAAALKMEPLGPYLDAKSKEVQGAVKNVGSYTPPPPFMPGQGLVFLDKITATGTWGPKGAMLLTGPKAGDKAASISVCPFNAGSWRRAMCLTAWNDPARGVELALPISVRLSRWYLDLSDDQSPFCSHEHDPGLTPSFGRRVWALGFGLDSFVAQTWPETSKSAQSGQPLPGVVKTRMVLGYIGLDRYKDWVLDWPEDKAKAIYPHGLATPAIVERIKKTLDQHPEKALLEKLYIITGKDETGKANAEAAIGMLKGAGVYTGDWSPFGLTAYIQTYQHPWTVYVDSALAWPGLPADQRQEIRRYLALASYLFSEPDYNPRGAGMHLGNPNMPIGRTEVLSLFAGLLPDHPMYPYWMGQLKDITTFRLASNTEPGGAWFEPPTYQMYGPTRALSLAQIILKNAGVADLAKEGWHKAALTYDANLTMPDIRCKGWRVLPGMGNSGITLEGIWGIGMGVFDLSDRDFESFCRFMHRLASGNQRVSQGDSPEYSFCFLSDVPERPQTLKTTFTPGYGVSFRAHFGSPDETGMLFRCGYNHSHWDMDDLNTVLYAKGAPLSPGTGYQYYYGPANEKDAIYHNRVKVWKLDAHEPFGRIENVIQDYGFGDWTDYAVGREYYPPEYFGEKDKGDMDWRRHVLFLKSTRPDGANYFAMRDTFPGGKDRPTWWHWLNLDTADLIAVDGKPFDKDKTAFNKVVPEDQMPTLTGKTVEMKTKYGAGTFFWFAANEPLTAKTVMTFDYQVGPNYHHRAFGKAGVFSQEDKETKTILRIAGKPGQDFFYVVYPHKDAENLPTCTQVSEGCIKVQTPESTDYCFISDAPLDFQKEDVVFTGKAGAVRVFPDRVVFCMNSGSGKIGYKGYVLEGNGPFERVVSMADLKPGLQSGLGGIRKQIATVDIAQGIRITGEMPFETKLEGETIHIKTSGRARVFTVTRPPFILRPELKLDGRQWMAGWSDEAGSDWGRWKNTEMMAVSTLDGDHELVISNMVYPKVWDRQFAPMIGLATP